MKDLIIKNLSSHIESSIVRNLIETYDELLSKHHSGDVEGALTKAGRFVEHTLRALEYLYTSKVPVEIKSVRKSIERLENQSTLPESIRLLIPRVAYGMIYNLRNKRDAVHVKEINPTQIDVSLSVAAASWVIAELIRHYHVSNEKDVMCAMMALSRTTIPMIETIDGEVLVSQKVPAKVEILLLLAHSIPSGMTRKELGKTAKCSSSSVTITLKMLIKKRLVHENNQGFYFITSKGELDLTLWNVNRPPKLTNLLR